MSHVIVVYAGPNNRGYPFGLPTGLYHGPRGPSFPRRDRAIREVNDASRSYGATSDNTARYAVHRWLGSSPGPQSYEVPDASLLSSPVYVPPGSEDCAAHFINASSASNPILDHNGPTYPVAIGVDFGSLELRTLAAMSGPVRTTEAVYPIDPSLPLELEDGTPCELVENDPLHAVGHLIRVRVLAEPNGPYAHRHGSWWHRASDGRWEGNSSYLRLRNVLSHTIAAPSLASVIPAAVMASTKPLPLAETKAAAGDAPTFEIRAGLTGTDRETWGTVAEGFTSGKEAAAWVSERKAEYASAGKSLHIVKREAPAVAIDWRARERERFESGAYVPLPGQWADMVAKAYPDHFAHVATSDKRKVAFTETAASGERDKQKVLSAAEYANRYFDRYDRYAYRGGNQYWGGGQRSEFISEMCGASTNVLFAPLGDVEAMDRIYAACNESGYDGIASCMTHSGCDYVTGERPVRVYAMGGDITIAFLRGYEDDENDEDGSSNYGLADPDADWDGDGAIIARCLVWPEAKQYARVYGDATSARTLRSALEAQGYRQGDLSGAKIARVAIDPEEMGEDNTLASYAYVMPYLDIGGGQFSIDEDDSTVFLIGAHGSQTFGAGGTDGVAYAPPKVPCDHCEIEVPATHLRDILVAKDETEQWCPRCRDSGTTYVDDLNTYVPLARTVSYVRAGRQTWRARTVADWQLEANGGDLPGLEVDGYWREDAFRCEDCSETFESVARHHDGREEDVCHTCFEERETAANTSEDDTAIAA